MTSLPRNNRKLTTAENMLVIKYEFIPKSNLESSFELSLTAVENNDSDKVPNEQVKGVFGRGAEIGTPDCTNNVGIPKKKMRVLCNRLS